MPIVYAGFGALMLTTCISYLSHAQVKFLRMRLVLMNLSLVFIGLGDDFCFIVDILEKIWALQDGTSVVVGGKTNRAKAEFPNDMNHLLDKLPELVESSRSKE